MSNLANNAVVVQRGLGMLHQQAASRINFAKGYPDALLATICLTNPFPMKTDSSSQIHGFHLGTSIGRFCTALLV